MKQLTLLIKPASSACNMRCRYCFYVDEARHRETGNRGIMTKETRDCLIARAIEAVEEKGTIQFSFQGGEPTVAGLEFFQDFVDTVGRMDQGKHEIFTGWGRRMKEPFGRSGEKSICSVSPVLNAIFCV